MTNMKTIQFSELRPGTYINYEGEIYTMEQAAALIASGAKPVLYTISDEWIHESLMAASRERKAGKPVSDVYSAPDPHAIRILYQATGKRESPMNEQLYEKMQADLTALMSDQKRKNLRLNAAQWEAYKTAVLACKSALSSYSPVKR